MEIKDATPMTPLSAQAELYLQLTINDPKGPETMMYNPFKF